MRSHRFTKPYNLKNYKFGIVTLVGILSVLGILVVGSAKESLQSKQILGVIIGFTAMIVVSLIDYMWIMNFYWVLYALSIIMLAAVKLFGENVNGATRWAIPVVLCLSSKYCRYYTANSCMSIPKSPIGLTGTGSSCPRAMPHRPSTPRLCCRAFSRKQSFGNCASAVLCSRAYRI